MKYQASPPIVRTISYNKHKHIQKSLPLENIPQSPGTDSAWPTHIHTHTRRWNKQTLVCRGRLARKMLLTLRLCCCACVQSAMNPPDYWFTPRNEKEKGEKINFNVWPGQQQTRNIIISILVSHKHCSWTQRVSAVFVNFVRTNERKMGERTLRHARICVFSREISGWEKRPNSRDYFFFLVRNKNIIASALHVLWFRRHRIQCK